MIDPNLQQLKVEVQRHLGFPISKISDLRNLQEAIENTTNTSIGFNTLRRFFGFLDQTNPSLRTLDTMSNYLGHRNYYTFKKHLNFDAEWDSWSRIIKIELSTVISSDDIQWLILQAKTSEIHLKLASLVKSFIYTKNFIALNQLFDGRIINLHEDYQLKFAANICKLLKYLDPTILKEIATILIPNQVFRENIIHWYVDYSNLNGYYGYLITAAIPHSKSDSHELLFYELIQNYNAFLSQKKDFLPIGTDRIRDDFHPVLKGRCFAYNLVYWNYNTNSKEYEATWQKILNRGSKSNDLFLFTLEIFPALLILKDFEKTSYLINTYYEDLLAPIDWSGYHIQMVVLLAHCIQLILENNIKEAVKSFDLISTVKLNTSYQEYSMLFYCIVKYHLAMLDQKSAEQLVGIENDYYDLVRSTGFTFFSADYLKNYLT